VTVTVAVTVTTQVELVLPIARKPRSS
jgi:hypothetical protein